MAPFMFVGDTGAKTTVSPRSRKQSAMTATASRDHPRRTRERSDSGRALAVDAAFGQLGLAADVVQHHLQMDDGGGRGHRAGATHLADERLQLLEEVQVLLEAVAR